MKFLNGLFQDIKYTRESIWNKPFTCSPGQKTIFPQGRKVGAAKDSDGLAGKNRLPVRTDDCP